MLFPTGRGALNAEERGVPVICQSGLCLSWAGISEGAFDLITDYENSCYCKPNPAYYLDICEKMDIAPTRCLMIGNNAEEDIRAAQRAGLSTFLLTDCLIAEGEIPDTPKGSFPELIEFLAQL